jgi:BolA protein
MFDPKKLHQVRRVMRVQQSIEIKLQNQLKPNFLQVENESRQHNVPSGSESHFKVTIVSASFEGISSVKRHQQVYRVLNEELQGGVHALSLRCLTPTQWLELGGQIHLTPNCRGGSGH